MEGLKYPDALGEIYYKAPKDNPSYGTEFPHDLSYDPGAISGLYELNYFPSSGGSALLILLPLGLILFLFFFRKYLVFQKLGTLIWIAALVLSFFGPIRLPSFFPFNTALGLVKGLGLFLIVYAGMQHFLSTKNLGITISRSFIPIITYVISLLLSVFVMTNPTFFVQDFSMVVTGIMFYYISYVLFTWEETRVLLLTWAKLLIVPCLLVLSVFFSRATGTLIMATIFPRYENFVFLHDLARNRIFSIIDFEYFVPALIVLLLSKTGKPAVNKFQFYVLTALSFITILLVNYRYRFLTYTLGFFIMYFFLKNYRAIISKSTIIIILFLSICYFTLSFTFSRSTIIDRFLLQNYTEDKVSVDRRFVMYQQAWDLFLQKPLLGVGMGNYKDNVEIVYSRYGGRVYEPNYKILQNVYAYPHNWFLTVLAENGIIGFVVLMWMLYIFLSTDLQLYKKMKDDKLVMFVALSSITWLYIFANFFTMMHVSLPIVIVFWSIRGIIDRIYVEETRTKTLLNSNPNNRTKKFFSSLIGKSNKK